MGKVYKLLEALEKRVTNIEELKVGSDLDVLMKKVEDIESFLNYRTRGYYERSKSR